MCPHSQSLNFMTYQHERRYSFYCSMEGTRLSVLGIVGANLQPILSQIRKNRLNVNLKQRMLRKTTNLFKTYKENSGKHTCISEVNVQSSSPVHTMWYDWRHYRASESWQKAVEVILFSLIK